MTTTPILGLPLLAAAQAQNHVTHNEALEVLDAIVAIAVRDRHLAGPPAAPAPLAAEGERFIVADNPTDDWVGKARHVAQRRDGGWRFFAPKAGWVARTLDDGEMVVFDGTDWRPLLSSGADVAQVSRLGVGTPSDANNAFAFKGGQLFFTAKTAAEGGDGDLRLVLNKENAGDVLSVLFQRGWSARAELGLVGGDDLTLRVSPDGSTWLDAFSVDRASGRVAFTAGVVRIERVAISSSANFVAPAWARRALIRGVGGGGGGGRRGAAGTSRGGGGGGSHAVYVERELFASVGGVTNHFNPGATFAVTIGAGGAGGIAVAANDTNGAAGANGGITSVMIGSVEVFRASGGVGGLGGTATTAAGGWQAIASTLGLNTQGGTGGAPSGTNAVWSSHAGGSGGGGGGVGATDAPGGGGWGGSGSLNIGTSMGGAPGTAGVAGSVGASPVDTSFGGGGGGGGGAGAIGGGGARGAGGGGGGGSMNGTSSGAGGAGGNGFVEITWFG
jgi:hypothetical protein